MAINDYTIKFSSSDDASTAGAYTKPSFVVGERTLNKTSTSITLFGKYVSGYGEDLQTDLVRMLENYARDVSPANPTVGQLWFDTKSKLLKVYTPTSSGNVWNAVGGGSGGSGSGSSTLAIATISSLGGIIVGTPFEVSSTGVLSLPNVAYAAAVAATSSPAEYNISANLLVTGSAYSSDTNNFIAPTASKPASYFNKFFITKAYADNNYIKTSNAPTLPAWLPTITPTKGVLIYDGTNATWSKAGAANQVLTCTDSNGTVSWTTVTGSGVIPVATRTVLGGVRPQHPITINGLGDIGLDDVNYRVYTPATSSDPAIPAQYDFTANIKTSGDAYSSDLINNIGSDPTRAATDYDPYYITKKYADTHYAAVGSSGGGSSTPTIATKTALGGIIVGDPFDVSVTGVLSLPGVTYSAPSSEYTIDMKTKMSKPMYSSDQDNTVDADNGKPSTYYDGYYITKHYADGRYAKLSGGTGGGSSYTLPTASSSVMGGIKVGDPFSISATGVLSLAKMAYDNAKSLYKVTAAIEMGDVLYSTDVRNKVDSDTTKPTNFYDGYFITKSYADARYAPIAAGGSSGSSGSVASATAVGGIKIAAPFAIDATTSVLSLRQVTYTDPVAGNPSATPPVAAVPAEYVIDASIKSSKWLYSTDVDNMIGTDSSKAATYYDGFFVTKHYADAHYAPISGSGGAGGTNPYTLVIATGTTLGGIKVGTPFAIDASGVLSLPNISYTTAGSVNTYEFTDNIKTTEIVSTDNDNKIFSETGKPADYYDKHFVTKHFADHNYMLSTAAYTLPPATSTVLGGVKVKAPLNVDSNGELSLPYFTLDNTKTEYDVNANVKVSKDAYSSDPDNNIGKDPLKAITDYDPYFITKHYADAHYQPSASTQVPGSANFTVTEPLMVTGTVLSLRKTIYDSVHDEYRFAANIKTLASAYSADLDNNISKLPSVPAADYDYYFTTKHYTDNNYLKLGTAFDTSATAKSVKIIEYATGFTLTDLDGKDGALVTKKYVDDKTVGPTTKSSFADGSVVFSSGTTLAESTDFKYDATNNQLKVKGLVLESITTDKTAAVTVYNPTSSATSGASVNLFSSPAPVTPALTKPANASGTLLGSVRFGGWDSKNPYIGAKLEAFSSELWTENVHGCNLVLSVTKNGQKDPVPALIVNNDNSISVPGGIVETIYTTGAATWTLDPSQGSMQILTTAANTTITMPAAAALTGKSVTVLIKYTGAHTITWSGAISWESNFVPVPTSIAGTTDLFSFFGDGTKIYGLCGGQAFP